MMKVRWKQVLPYHVVREGERLPWGMRVSYFRLDTKEAVCYPLPFHWVIKWGYRLWLWSLGYTPTHRERSLQEAYNTGFKAGYKAHAREIEHLIDRKFGKRP